MDSVFMNSCALHHIVRDTAKTRGLFDVTLIHLIEIQLETFANTCGCAGEKKSCMVQMLAVTLTVLKKGWTKLRSYKMDQLQWPLKGREKEKSPFPIANTRRPKPGWS
jgi:hypothetical protein